MKVVRVTLGTIVGLLGLLGLGIAGTGIWAEHSHRDADGYFATGTHSYASGGYAITHAGVDINDVPDWLSNLARVRIRATAGNGKSLFVGIGPRDRVAAYLAGAARSDIRDVDLDPFKAKYNQIAGTAKPTPPTREQFWTATATGNSPTLTWKPSGGNWSFVVMNADGSRGVATEGTVGAHVRYLGWVWLGLILLGLVLVASGVALIVGRPRGRRPLETRGGEADTVDVPAWSYPATLSARLDEPLSRWKWLVKWFLAIPHYIVLIVLAVVFLVLTIVAWFAILFTGRYPRGIFDFNLGVMRWGWRVHAYTFGALSTDRYPPFSMQREDDYPATLDVEYPEHLSRGLIFVKWLLAIPHLIITGILAGGGTYFAENSGSHWGGGPWSGLIGLLALIAGFALLFTDRYPRGLFDLIMGLNRWVLRTAVYVMLMTDEYPPFRLDQGGDEPTAPATAPVASPL